MDLEQLKSLDHDRVLVVDTETTGLKPYETDEILSLTILDLDGNVIFDEMVRQRKRPIHMVLAGLLCFEKV